MSRRSYFAIAILFPLIALATWLCLDYSYPVSDAEQYFSLSLKLYSTFVLNGFWKGLSTLYLFRDWKPILLQPLGTIALFLSHGSSLWAVKIFNLAFFSMLLIFTYLGFEIALTPAMSALATCFMGLLPWCAYNAHVFTAETSGLAFSIGALYFLYRSSRSEGLKYICWFGIFLGFALCIRPIETFLFFLIPVTIWTVSEVRKKNLKFWEPLLYVLIFSPLGAIFLLDAPVPRTVTIPLAIFPISIVWALRSRLGMSKRYSVGLPLALFMAAVWFAPGLSELRAWTWGCSFGSVVSNEFGAHHVGFRLLGRWLYWFLGVPFAVLLGLSFFARGARGNMWISHWRRFGVIFLILFFPLIIGMVSYSISLRYYVVSTYLLFAAVLVLVLSESGPARRLRIGTVGALAALFFAWSLQTIISPDDAYALLPQDFELEFYFYVSPVTELNPKWHADAAAIIHALEGHLPPHGRMDISIYNALPGNIDQLYAVLMSEVALENGKEWTFTYRAASKPKPFLLAVRSRGMEGDFISKEAKELPDWTRVDTIPFDFEDGKGSLILYVAK